MIHIWKNTYNESMGEHFSRVLKDKKQIDTFNMLWYSFRLTYITKSSFFESIRIGDDKNSIWVHKGKNEIITVKYITS